MHTKSVGGALISQHWEQPYAAEKELRQFGAD